MSGKAYPPARMDEAVLEERAAHELHVDIFPGTDVMRDVDDIRFTHGPKSHEVLIPHPSADPHDPLNWSRSWKYLVIANQFLYTFLTVESALSLAPMFPLLAKEYHLDQTQVGLLTGVCVLALGYANFIIVPFSNIFGRRGALILFGIITCASTVWEALAKSHGSLLGARVVNGIGTATSESVMVQVIADVFFLHERGLWMGVYFTSYFLGLFIGPVIAGNIAERHSWRSFFWLSLGLTAFNLILLVFLFPETKYHRDAPSRSTTQGTAEYSVDEKNVKDSLEHDEEPSSLPAKEAGVTSLVGRGSPAKHQFKLIQRPDPRWKSFLFRDIFSPLYVFLFPIIFWAGLNVAGPANLLLFWNLTESSVLSNPPYNWSPGAVGYSNFAFAVGGVLGLVTAGPFSDWVAKQMTKRNNGVREAEMRLPALIPYFITTIIGIVVGGLAYERQWKWQLILVFGYGLTGLCVTTVPTIAIAYAVDCYKPIAGEIMVVATVLKNTGGFAMSYWVPPLAAQKGLFTPTMVEFALTVGLMLLALPLYFFGKRLRKLTRNSAVHRYEADI